MGISFRIVNGLNAASSIRIAAVNMPARPAPTPGFVGSPSNAARPRARVIAMTGFAMMIATPTSRKRGKLRFVAGHTFIANMTGANIISR